MVKVLLIDNDATLRMIAKNAIEKEWLDKCKVLLAINGAEGIKIAAKEMPVLIILDVIMPGLDGVQTLKKLREQGIETPVIFVTAKEGSELEELNQYKDLNVIGVLKKPFTPKTLLDECNKVMEGIYPS